MTSLATRLAKSSCALRVATCDLRPAQVEGERPTADRQDLGESRDMRKEASERAVSNNL